MRSTRRSPLATLAALACAVALVAVPNTAMGHEGDFVDEYPDDPYVCGGAFTEGAWCEIAVGGGSFTVEIDYTADDPDALVWAHVELAVLIPETLWGVRVLECERQATGSTSCTAEIGAPAAADVPGAEFLTCGGHVHLLPPRETGSGTFRCLSGDR